MPQILTKSNSTDPQIKKNFEENAKKIKEKDHKMVKGIFRCFEPVGGSFTFSFKKYKEDSVITMTMEDGKTYEVPYMIARHLNENCSYSRHSHILDAEGNPTLDTSRKVKRCSFESLDFFV